jgi:hypothetical protein
MAAGGGTDCVRFVLERLEGFRPMEEVLAKQGALGGRRRLQVVRLWGRELLLLLQGLHCAHGPRILAYHLHSGGVGVSADGARLKLLSLAHCGSLGAGGDAQCGSPARLASAPDPPACLMRTDCGRTPPEAAQVRLTTVDGRPRALVVIGEGALAGSAEAPTSAWDVWQFGALLHRMVTGRELPPFAAQLQAFLDR